MDPNLLTACDRCGLEYELNPRAKGTQLYIFLADPRCNYIESACPRCGDATTEFCDEQLTKFYRRCGFSYTITSEPPFNIREARNEADVDAFIKEVEAASPSDFV